MIVLYLLLSVILIVLLTARWHVHPFVALLIVAIAYGIAAGMPLQNIITSVNEGFGNTLGGIGMIIILGVIIGAFLEHSGGAYALADKLLHFTGKKRAPLAMSLIGWVVSIPVFADSGFMLLSPLSKSIAKKAKFSLATMSIALAFGLGLSHTLVPPTPGPIAAAYYVHADLGLVMLIGIPISLATLFIIQIFINRYVSKTYIDPAPDLSDNQINQLMSKAPSALRSSIPIIVPIMLIIVKSILITVFGYDPEGDEVLPFHIEILLFIGEPFIALLIACFLSLTLPRKISQDMLSTEGWIGKALVGASSIILITGAGGIFGQVLRDSGIADVLGSTLSQWNISLWLPFLISAAIKTAQGSSTVALITTATILAPMMGDLGFVTEMQKALVVIAIGAGSAVVIHANDSFFWVVTRMTGLEVNSGYRFLSLGSFIFGTTAALLTFILSLILA